MDYKQRRDISPHEQMVTAFPEVRSLELEAGDEFPPARLRRHLGRHDQPGGTVRPLHTQAARYVRFLQTSLSGQSDLSTSKLIRLQALADITLRPVRPLYKQVHPVSGSCRHRSQAKRMRLGNMCWESTQKIQCFDQAAAVGSINTIKAGCHKPLGQDPATTKASCTRSACMTCSAGSLITSRMPVECPSLL